ncbi:3'(2'),5'-bisphosphate nucleotidase CysQ [Thauera aromatica]|nr:3'(2'),5'-bisphosphate nucleotidase CysQ [Thauera aromatica]MCK2128180.1 3'(2'),5'-bisphosphate nucleotidase CysQ [Thauera aromatica]
MTDLLRSPHDTLQAIAGIARHAGDAILEVYASDFEVRGKDDASPVTAADERAEAIILAGLRALSPDVHVIAEEEVAAGRVPEVDRVFWLVDPLDGTKEFINRNGEFTVNIALVVDGQPGLGAVFAPALDRMFLGAQGSGAFVEEQGHRRPIACRTVPAEGLVVVASRSHGDAAALESFLAGRQVAETRSAGSSLKLCLVASGEADVYPRLGRTMEWDIAGGHAVLLAAGGRIEVVADGTPLRYGKPGFDNPHFAAWGAGAQHNGHRQALLPNRRR